MTDIGTHPEPRMQARQAPQTHNGVTAVGRPLDISIVMPCLNEEEAVRYCVEKAVAAIAATGMTGEVVVVDNNSTDNSAELARAAGARVVDEAIRGYGSAYLRGLAEARGRFILIGDSDGTYDFSAVEQFVQPLTNGTDLVVGSRLRGTIHDGAMPWLHRYVGNPFLTRTMNVLFRNQLSDVYCGMRAMKRELLTTMRLSATGMEFALEMLIEAQRHGARIKEIPISYSRRAGGQPKLRTWRDGWRSFMFIINESRGFRGETRTHAAPALSSATPAPSESGS
jgi:glycosyltransferase involved in cell wall biosynthesis